MPFASVAINRPFSVYSVGPSGGLSLTLGVYKHKCYANLLVYEIGAGTRAVVEGATSERVARDALEAFSPLAVLDCRCSVHCLALDHLRIPGFDARRYRGPHRQAFLGRRRWRDWWAVLKPCGDQGKAPVHAQTAAISGFEG